MLPAPATALSALLCVLLLTGSAPASSGTVLSFFAGDSVTFNCSEEANRIRNVSQISMIVWWKDNGSHILHFISDRGKHVSNFTDPRISFMSAEIPPKLQIRDARPEDAGIYTCEISAVMTSSGRFHKSWRLHITDSAPASALVLFSTGDSVTFSCSEEANRIRNVSQITMIVWWKENGSHILHFISDGGKHVSNFTDPRISFTSAEIHPRLQIRDARPEDAGIYTCEITAVMTSSGRFHKSWRLHITVPEPSRNKIISISCSVAGAIILVIIAGIVYWKFCTNHKTIPFQIHQTSTDDNNEKEEPVYDNIQDDCFLHFNSLYDRTPAVPMSRRSNDP